VVEHHLDVIKCADWVIDLGPGGGDSGGYIVAQRTPEEIGQNEESITGTYLKPLLVQNLLGSLNFGCRLQTIKLQG